MFLPLPQVPPLTVPIIITIAAILAIAVIITVFSTSMTPLPPPPSLLLSLSSPPTSHHKQHRHCLHHIVACKTLPYSSLSPPHCWCPSHHHYHCKATAITVTALHHSHYHSHLHHTVASLATNTTISTATVLTSNKAMFFLRMTSYTKNVYILKKLKKTETRFLIVYF